MKLSSESEEWNAMFNDISKPTQIKNEIFPFNNSTNKIYIEHPWNLIPLISMIRTYNKSV